MSDREPSGAAVYMTAPDHNGDEPPPRRSGARSMIPLSWLDRPVRIEYAGPDGMGREASATLLDWTPVGLLLIIAGARCLMPWERIVLLELRSG